MVIEQIKMTKTPEILQKPKMLSNAVHFFIIWLSFGAIGKQNNYFLIHGPANILSFPVYFCLNVVVSTHHFSTEFIHFYYRLLAFKMNQFFFLPKTAKIRVNLSF